MNLTKIPKLHVGLRGGPLQQTLYDKHYDLCPNVICHDVVKFWRGWQMLPLEEQSTDSCTIYLDYSCSQ
jgi:hypothetical protein